MKLKNEETPKTSWKDYDAGQVLRFQRVGICLRADSAVFGDLLVRLTDGKHVQPDPSEVFFLYPDAEINLNPHAE